MEIALLIAVIVIAVIGFGYLINKLDTVDSRLDALVEEVADKHGLTLFSDIDEELHEEALDVRALQVNISQGLANGELVKTYEKTSIPEIGAEVITCRISSAFASEDNHIGIYLMDGQIVHVFQQDGHSKILCEYHKDPEWERKFHTTLSHYGLIMPVDNINRDRALTFYRCE